MWVGLPKCPPDLLIIVGTARESATHHRFSPPDFGPVEPSVAGRAPSRALEHGRAIGFAK